MDIKLNIQPLTVEVIVNNETVKQEDITVDEYKSYIYELVGDDSLMLDSLRKANKMFKPKSYMFKDIG